MSNELNTRGEQRFGTRITQPALAAIFCSGSASAIDYQVHGYAAQGFVLSSHNDFFGDSTDGSFNYYEAGINAAVQVQPNLSFAAQAAIRDAGISDDGSFRLDYAVADYRLVSEESIQSGLRAGKVKNALGFYNETRDVVFTRPSILLPSVYSDNQNQRSLIFTSPGAQVYGGTVIGLHELSFTGTRNAEHDVRESDERLLVTLDRAVRSAHRRFLERAAHGLDRRRQVAVRLQPLLRAVPFVDRAGDRSRRALRCGPECFLGSLQRRTLSPSPPSTCWSATTTG